MTMPIIIGLARADADERTFFERVIGKGRVEDGDVERATEILRRTGALDETRERALAWAAAAREALELVPQGPLTDTLGDLTDYGVRRIT